MKLQKVIIDGVEYYKEIPDATEDLSEGACTDASEGDGECGTERGAHFVAQASAFLERLGGELRVFGERIADGAESLGQRIATGTQRLLGRDTRRRENTNKERLLRLLPYTDAEGRHEIFELLLCEEGGFCDVELSGILPFFCREDCDTLFMKKLGEGDADMLVRLYRFVSRPCLGALVDAYIDGRYPTLDIAALYPYLGEEDIKRIFDLFTEKNT